MVSVLLKSDTDVAAARDMDKLRKENGNWGETELCTWKNNGVKWEKKSVVRSKQNTGQVWYILT